MVAEARGCDMAKVTSTITHTATYHSVIDEKELHQLISEYVASKAGLDLSTETVSSKVHITNRNSGSINGCEYQAAVTLTKNLQPGAV